VGTQVQSGLNQRL